MSREFVKKAIKLLTRVMLPEMATLVPKDGNWTLMIDGTQRAKYDDVLIIIAAVPLDSSEANIIPLVARFLPSENVKDILELLHELKPRLPSLPKSVLSDFRPGLVEAIGRVFPNSTAHGCHYHIIEMIARILIHPLINQIKKKLRSAINELNRWAHHSIYGRKSNNLVLVARGLQKVVTGNHGKFGTNFLQFCKKFQALTAWIEKNGVLLQSDKRYRALVRFLDHKLWRQLAPQLSQLEFVLRQFNHLRRCLTMQDYKTEILTVEEQSSGIMPLDQLIHEWIKLGGINTRVIFHKRFKKAVKKLQDHYELLIPAILDPHLPRTTSLLENLYGLVKRVLRTWSGSMKIRLSFQWAAPLAAISQSLQETGLFARILAKQTGYDWIEQQEILAKTESRNRSEIRFANELANKTPTGLVNQVAHLIIRDIIG